MSKDKEGSCSSSDKDQMEHKKTACDSQKPEDKKKQEEELKAKQASAQHTAGAKKDGGCCSH